MSTDVEPHRTGRRTKLTPETAERIISAVRAGNYLDTAARAAGVSPTTVYRWLQEADEPTANRRPQREFREALERARGEAETSMVAAVVKAAQGGYVVKRVERKGKGGHEVEETYAPADGRVALEYLSRAFPDRWARRSALEVTGAEGGPIQVSAERLNGLADRVTAVLAAAGDDVIEGEVAG